MFVPKITTGCLCGKRHWPKLTESFRNDLAVRRYPGSISTLFAGSGSGEQRRGSKGDRLSVLFCLHAALRRVTSEPHLGRCRGRVDVC
jgi:hypothetical protein